MSAHDPLIIIPDLHGHRSLLERLINYLQREGLLDDHRLAFLGDYVDRGPDSRGTIELVCSLVAEGHVAIAGNHDLVLSKVLDTEAIGWESWVRRWAKNYESGVLLNYGLGHRPALGDIVGWRHMACELREAVPASHQIFLRQLPWFIETDTFVLIHAGLEQDVSWTQQKKQLEERSSGANGPSQLFSHVLARSLRHPAVSKQLVSGHASTPNPVFTPERVRLDCGVDFGGPLMAWVPDRQYYFRVAH